MLAYDLSSIECPQCNTNDDIEVIGEHILTGSNHWPIYDFICYRCRQVFTEHVFLNLKES